MNDYRLEAVTAEYSPVTAEYSRGSVTGPILNGRFVHSDVYHRHHPPPKYVANYWRWRQVLQGGD